TCALPIFLRVFVVNKYEQTLTTETQRRQRSYRENGLRPRYVAAAKPLYDRDSCGRFRAHYSSTGQSIWKRCESLAQSIDLTNAVVPDHGLGRGSSTTN